MFIKILNFINNAYIYVIDYYEINLTSIRQKEKLIHEYLLDVKTILNEMNDAKKDEIELFTKTFQNIVEDHMTGKNNAVMWPLPYTIDDQKNCYISFNADPNSIYQIQLSIVKKLVFNDLLFYYYDFCYRMNEKFSEMNKSCEQKLGKVSKLLIEVRKVKKISYNELNLAPINKLVSKDFYIYQFFNELKIIVCRYFGLGEFQIEDILCTGLKIFFLDFKEFVKAYKQINYCIKTYNTSMSSASLKYQNTLFHKSRKDSFINFENNFLNCLTLDITEEFEKRLQLPKDKRFETYKKSMKHINNCKTCTDYCKDMLRNVICVTHRKNLIKIRTEFFVFMDDSWFSDSILIRESLFKKFCLLLS